MNTATIQTASHSLQSIRRMVVSELRYSRWWLLLAAAIIILVYGFLGSSKLDYDLLVFFLIMLNYRIVWLRSKEMRERTLFSLPTSRWAGYVERIATPMCINCAFIALGGALMSRPAFAELHDALPMRLVSMVLLLWLYNIGITVNLDTLFEKDRGPWRFLIPGICMFLWVLLYLIYATPELFDPIVNKNQATGALSRGLFETVPGIVVMTVFCLAMVAVDYRMFRGRSVIGKVHQSLKK